MKYYDTEKKHLICGFGTWDTRSLTTHVYMPQGFAVNICIKEYLNGMYLKEALIGRQGANDAVVLAGPHTWDNSYTELTIEWSMLTVFIRTAAVENDFVLCVELLENDTRLMPLCVLESSVLWNRPGYAERIGETLAWSNPEGDSMKLRLAQGSICEDPYCGCNSAYLPISLSKPVYAFIGKERTTNEIEAILQNNKKSYMQYKDSFGRCAEAWVAMQTCLAWNEVYDPLKDRLISNVSRIWNVGRGGYGMFCWDNFFAGMMISLDSPARGRMNAIEILNEVTAEGFVPNTSNGNGRKSFDRSQPPVGSYVCLEIYKRDPQKWFLQEVYPKLLRWNKWWQKERRVGNLLCWGSNDYDNIWMRAGVHDRFGAALESGLDNSPMYDDIPFDANKNVLCLWDVGLNGLYAMDLNCLVEIAEIIGDVAEANALRKRYVEHCAAMNSLWNDEKGIYQNRRTDTKEYSSALSPTNFYAAAGHVPTQEQYARMIREHMLNPKEFWGRWILPSISRDNVAYYDNNYWRGRIWAPMNFLVYIGMEQYDDVDGVMEQYVDKCLALIMKEWQEERHVHENYNAETGDGDDVTNSDRFYHWGGLLSWIAIMEQQKNQKRQGA